MRGWEKSKTFPPINLIQHIAADHLHSDNDHEETFDFMKYSTTT